MFEDISEKIKDSATILFWSGIITCFFVGVAVGILYRMMALGFIIVSVGGVLTYFISLLVYAYGQLIEKTERIEEDNNTIKWKIWGIINSQTCEKEKTDN